MKKEVVTWVEISFLVEPRCHSRDRVDAAEDFEYHHSVSGKGLSREWVDFRVLLSVSVLIF